MPTGLLFLVGTGYSVIFPVVAICPILLPLYSPEAARRHGFTESEFREWTEEYHRAGVDALKINKKGLEAEYRAEAKRLQAKIGELVMENEIRKEAMRPFALVEPMFPGSLLDDDGQKPSSVGSLMLRAAPPIIASTIVFRSSMRLWLNASSTSSMPNPT